MKLSVQVNLYSGSVGLKSRIASSEKNTNSPVYIAIVLSDEGEIYSKGDMPLICLSMHTALPSLYSVRRVIQKIEPICCYISNYLI